MNPIKILIVEDEFLVASELRIILQSQGFRTIYVAATGEKAIDIAFSSQPDVVLMDIILKGDIDGIETANRIRSKLDIPIIYISGNSNMKCDERLLASQPFAFLEKPVPDSRLHKVLVQAVGPL
ncbi:MAG TPA: response regulator [bacterium]|nr:response regulator [bacterium]HPN45447.1 response regulator [bacterium]